MIKHVESWDEQWAEPKTKLERVAPLFALALAVLIAWL